MKLLEIKNQKNKGTNNFDCIILWNLNLKIINTKKKSHQYWWLWCFWENENYFPFLSSETVSFFLPRARRRAITALPFAVAILCLNPCLFVRFRLLGWYVLFILPSLFGTAKLQENWFHTTNLLNIFGKMEPFQRLKPQKAQESTFNLLIYNKKILFNLSFYLLK